MKTMYLKIGLIVLFSMLIIIPVYAQEQNDKAVRDKIEQINKQMAQDMMNGNDQTMLNYYTEDAVSMPNMSKMLQGKDEIKQHYTDMKGNMPNFKNVNFQTVKVIKGGDLYVEIGKYNMNMEIKGMDKPISDEGKYMNIWKMMPDGSLKIVADTWNTNTSYEQMAGEMNKKENEDEMTGGKK